MFNNLFGMQAAMVGEWKARVFRVFVSSTFLDMRREREVLTQEVFPFVRRYCHERNVLFSYVDLRWGIPSEVCDFPTLYSFFLQYYQFS